MFFLWSFLGIGCTIIMYMRKIMGNLLLSIGGSPMENKRKLRARVIEIEFDAPWTMKIAVSWLVTGLILLAMTSSVHAQQGDQTQVAFNEKGRSDYSKASLSRQGDFGDANLSAQQMIAFFKTESSKLSKEISDLVERTNPGKASSLASNESDILQVAILKNKLEYFEVILKKWINEGDF